MIKAQALNLWGTLSDREDVVAAISTQVTPNGTKDYVVMATFVGDQAPTTDTLAALETELDGAVAEIQNATLVYR